MTDTDAPDAHLHPSSYRRCIERIQLSDGSPALKRLPKAVQAILSNFRGTRASIPRDAVPAVLVRLGLADYAAGKLPCQCTTPAGAYADMHHALDQLDRLAEVGCCSAG